MAQRRIQAPITEDERTSDPVDEFRSRLAIDRDDLDRSCEQQPELFYHVADKHAMAIAKKDAVKLRLEEAEAEAYKLLRQEALDNDEKVTEAQLAKSIQIDPTIKLLNRDMLEIQAKIARWAALRDAYIQRSYMLREMVPMYLSRLQSGSVRARNDIAEVNRQRADQERVRSKETWGRRSHD